MTLTELARPESNRHLRPPQPHRNRPHQYCQCEVRRLAPVQNRLDDVGCQQGEPQNSADIGSVYLLGRCDFFNDRELGTTGTVVYLIEQAPSFFGRQISRT
jgi:hypothetical protein